MAKKATKEKVVKELTDLPGIGDASAEKLKEGGFTNVMSIAVATPSELMLAAGLGESAARKIINFARNNFELGFTNGKELMEKRKKIIILPTGANDFDIMLNGGFESGGITEAYSQFGSGKTTLAHVMAVNIQKLDGECVWIDTEGTFRPERIIQIAQARGEDSDKILEKIHVVRAFNSDHQMFVAEKIPGMITEKKLPIKLVIVDSLMSHFRAEFIGRGTLASRQQKLNKHMHTLMKVADVHNLIVYVTNQVMAKPDTFFGDPTTPIGGHIVAHNSTTRLYLRRGKAGTRVAKLVDSPYLPDAEAVWKITDRGVENV